MDGCTVLYGWIVREKMILLFWMRLSESAGTRGVDMSLHRGRATVSYDDTSHTLRDPNKPSIEILLRPHSHHEPSMSVAAAVSYPFSCWPPC